MIEIERDLWDEVLMLAGIGLTDVRDQYAGRSMYGQVTLAVVVNGRTGALRFAAALGAVLGDDAGLTAVAGLAVDSYGVDTIVYWPRGARVID